MDELNSGGSGEWQDRDPLAAPPAAQNPAQPQPATVHQLGVMDLGLPQRGRNPGDPMAFAPTSDPAQPTAVEAPVAQPVDPAAEERERFIPRQRFDEVIAARTAAEQRLAELEAERQAWQQAPSAIPEDIAGYMPFIERLRMQGSPEQIEAMLREQDEAQQQAQVRQQNEEFLGQFAQLVAEGHMTQEGLDAIAPSLKPLLDQLAEVAPLVAERQRSRAEQAADAHVKRITDVYTHADPILLKKMMALGANPQDILADAKLSHESNLARYGRPTTPQAQQANQPAQPPSVPAPAMPIGTPQPVAFAPTGADAIPDQYQDPVGYANYWYRKTGDSLYLQLGARI